MVGDVMGHVFKISSIIVFALSLAGCGLLPKRGVEIHSVPSAGTTVVSFPSDQRGAFFRDNGSTGTYCAEPFPDTALDSVAKLAGKIDAGEAGSAEIDSELSTKVVELAGRSQLVLLARELLYRTCELAANGKLTSDQIVAQNNSIIELIARLGQADLTRAQADLEAVTAARTAAGSIVDDIIQ